MTRARTALTTVALLVLLQGCQHKTPPSPPPVATAPPLPPSSMTHEQSLPPVPQPGPPKAGPPGSDQQVAQQQPAPPPKRVRRVKKHVAPPESAPATSTTTSATATTPTTPAPSSEPAPSLGQLSAGNGADSHERAAMTEEIHAQELRLSAIKHPLNSDSEAIALQIKVFLVKAREAALENDLDGARTLTMKAKVLLDELSSS